MKIQFGVTAMLHATGEADITDDDQSIFIHPLRIFPVLVFFTPTPLSPEHTAVLQSMAMHQLVKLALDKVTPKDGLKEASRQDVNMAPVDGEKN